MSTHGYCKWVKNRNKPYKYADLLAQTRQILNQDSENKNYGIVRMTEALRYQFDYAGSQSTVARVMRENGLIHAKKRKPNGLTKADKEAQKADNLINRDFNATAPNEKWVTDITELPTIEGKLYISGIFDCYDNAVVGLTMDGNMRKELVMQTVRQAVLKYKPDRVILHSDRGSQYTSEDFKDALRESHILQSMNSAGGRCHDNAKCESMWGRAKEECFYKYNTARMRMSEVKSLVFRYFMSYWNNRRICSANGGIPPSVKRSRYYSEQLLAAA